MIRRATPADAEALSTLSRTCFTQTFGHLYDPGDLEAFLDEAYSPTVLRAELEDPHRATWLLFDDPSDEAPASSAPASAKPTTVLPWRATRRAVPAGRGEASVASHWAARASSVMPWASRAACPMRERQASACRRAIARASPP